MYFLRVEYFVELIGNMLILYESYQYSWEKREEI